MASQRLVRDKVTREDIEYVVTHMRARDRREIFALRWEDNDTTLINDVGVVAHAMWNAWRWDGEPVALNGIVPVRPGVVIASAFGTDKWRYALRAMVRRAWNFTIPALQAAGYHRGEAYVLAANADSRMFIEMLGGQIEAYLHQYGRNCEDFVLYTWRLNHVLQLTYQQRHTVSVLPNQ